MLISCKCKPGYIGTLCEHVNRCPYCDKNKCNEKLECTECKKGWEGPYCDKRVCSDINTCNGRGKYQINKIQMR